MGQTCTKACYVESDNTEGPRSDCPDPVMYDLMRKSIVATTKHQNSKRKPPGQVHLLYKNSKGSNHHAITSSLSSHVHGMSSPSSSISSSAAITGGISNTHIPGPVSTDHTTSCPTRLLIRRRSLRVVDEGGGTHIYAIRYPEDTSNAIVSEQSPSNAPPSRQEQCPPRKRHSPPPPMPLLEGDIFTNVAMASVPRQKVLDWVTVSDEHKIYIADVGLTPNQCDHIVSVTEQACRGQYAAYTYAKQTLGCREFPTLSQTCFHPVHTVVHAIANRLDSAHLQLDDREPHVVKYDVTKKERQKLDMHTDKSEWTFLIALSNGCGVDYEGGGTFFECLDATVHIQRGHALIFPGKLRHCGQKISGGLRFLLVGFLVDKTNDNNNNNSSSNNNNNNGGGTSGNVVAGGNTSMPGSHGTASSNSNATATIHSNTSPR